MLNIDYLNLKALKKKISCFILKSVNLEIQNKRSTRSDVSYKRALYICQTTFTKSLKIHFVIMHCKFNQKGQK